jgi:spermidine/putrescine transport system ATP-binding protein
MAEFAVRLTDIEKSFGSQRAVDGLSIDVHPGEFLTLLGPSGCGKTTTLRVIAGLEKPDRGSVYISDHDVTKYPANARPVNTVFQSYALFPHLSVFDNISFGLRASHIEADEAAERVGRQIEIMGLGGYEKKRPYQLSGGEQQRVALARALVLKPTVLLLDEPLASLDFKLRQRLQIQLKSWQREVGISFVMVTHDQNEALAMSDRIAVLNEGRLEQVGDPVAVYERPQSRFVAGFLGDANFLTGQVTHTDGDEVGIDVPGVGKMLGTDMADVAKGDDIDVVVRPEHITLRDAVDATVEGANHVNGVVEAVVIVGGLDRKVLLRLVNGVVIEALVRSDQAREFHVGQTMSAVWQAQDTLILAESPR